MSEGDALANAASALAGAPFRLYGRDPQTGLDCVGLCLASLAAIGRRLVVPASYGLRNSELGNLPGLAAKAGLEAANGPVQPGDILLVRLSPIQFHLMIAGPNGCFIHAHAGLRRVVTSPGPNLYPVVKHWRLGDIS